MSQEHPKPEAAAPESAKRPKLAEEKEEEPKPETEQQELVRCEKLIKSCDTSTTFVMFAVFVWGENGHQFYVYPLSDVTTDELSAIKAWNDGLGPIMMKHKPRQSQQNWSVRMLQKMARNQLLWETSETLRKLQERAWRTTFGACSGLKIAHCVEMMDE